MRDAGVLDGWNLEHGSALADGECNKVLYNLSIVTNRPCI